MKQMTQTCGCCVGIETITPEPTANRPGLTALSYRIGTHATFLETMLARLSGGDYPKLAELTTRETNDPAIALMDAWAVVADVLSFYNERIINEGYLATATERRSILELARLVGYELRPGVASSVYLAYSLDTNTTDEVLIPKGARSQSLPGPGELPQSFETSEDLKARAKWNNLKPRLTQPQTKSSIEQGDGKNKRIYLKGVSANLKPNDPLLIVFPDTVDAGFFRVKEVFSDTAANRTLVTLLETVTNKPAPVLRPPINIIGNLTLAPSVYRKILFRPLNLSYPTFNVSASFQAQTLTQADESNLNGATKSADAALLRKTLAGRELGFSVLKIFAPTLQETLTAAAKNAQVTEENSIKVYALRAKTSLFGHNAPKEPKYEPALSGEIPNPNAGNLMPQTSWPEWNLASDETAKTLYLDRRYEEILPDSYIAVLMNNKPQILEVADVQYLSRSAYGISGETTKIKLNAEWGLNTNATIDSTIRKTIVYAQSELLELAEEPIEGPLCAGEDRLIELDGVYEGLESGRWIVVSGEREIDGTSGVRSSELALLADVSLDVKEINDTALDGDKLHTFIKLANKLEYCFKRDTVTIYGNVVKATHGETRQEVLGSGDGAKMLQSFTLKQPPLTYVSASNPSGVDSTLKVYVNNIAWHETDALAGLAPTDRKFITKTDNEDKTSMIFGNGREGARLPSGIENIKAEYRNGIGKQGNVKAGQISLLTTKPLGTKAVINPLKASGGADKESRDQARKNAPLAIKALDRLVSVQDYQDFARSYAGIGKASAVELTDGRRQLVHVTVAGADDGLIDTNSDLYGNLRQSLLSYGDPSLAIRLEVRELMLLVIEARLRILPDYLWEPVVVKVRGAMLAAFSFECRELGQDVLLSEVISVMQAIPGVAYVDVDVLRGIPEKIIDSLQSGQRRLVTPGDIADLLSGPLKDADNKNIKEPPPRLDVNFAGFEGKALRPVQLAFLSPEVPATLILNQIN